ncbi:MAG: bifunctional riboflavin kinase/FAD synthetase [Clostridia bacterium]|nr:bifunctional riboflavin kinase/FAD synthetase [Clostridia bacterium]
MEIIDLQTMRKEEGKCCSPFSVALGNFDGVHKGHAELIRKAVSYAREHNIKSAVWTFAADGASLPNKPDSLTLTSENEKLSLIRELGVDYAILADFESVRGMSPETFVSEILIGECNAEAAVCGFNFRFGRGGVGDAVTLSRLMSPRECIIVEPVYVNDTLVSSSAVRELVESGDMETAAQMLGHPFSITAPVVEGKHLGRTIGIPTVNQNFPNGHIIPMSGIYACTVEISGKTYMGAANIGFRPTVESTRNINCETHIIDYDGCVYGEKVKVSFYKRLRGEMKFDSVEALREGIKNDIRKTREYFKK